MSKTPLPDPQRLVPLSEPVFHILLSLADSGAHGYGLILDVRRRTGGHVELSTSTLYGALKRMIRDGLITESGVRPAPEADDERRRYYQITDFGRKVVDLEAQRIKRLARLLRGKTFVTDGPAQTD